MEYFYNGDYEDLLDWIIDAYPPKNYINEGFHSWLKDVKLDFHTSGHHFSEDIRDEMREFWINNHFGKMGYSEELPEVRQRYKTFNKLRESGVFTTQDAYNANPYRKQPSIRRELQELIKENKLERVSKGVYRVK